MAESEKNSVDETCSHMDDDPCLKRSKSIDIIKELEKLVVHKP